jgi:bifunctional non-homologous end joining protein LigD
MHCKKKSIPIDHLFGAGEQPARPRMDRSSPADRGALKALPGSSAVIDGEGVVISTDGVSDFDELRSAVGRKGSRRAFLYAFDLLELNGKESASRVVGTRRRALTRLLAKTEGGIRLSEHIDGPDGRRQCGQLEPRRR